MQDRTTLVVDASRRDVTMGIRSRIREALEVMIEEELEAALGAKPSERTEGRVGYRNGSIPRRLVTEYGTREIEVARARLFEEGGRTREWRSEFVPRYARRTRAVEEAILGTYFAGVNTRRMRRSLSPLLGEESLSKSSISRIVSRLKGHWEAWRSRDLSQERIVFLYLDALNLRIRLARRVIRVPVLAALGVREDGEKVLVSLGVARSETTLAWTELVADLSARGLAAPAMVVIDGNPGLSKAVHARWGGSSVQRCTKHKLENLLAKAPKHVHGELRRDFHAIVYAEDLAQARKTYASFVRKWKLLSKEVVRSLEEAGEELLSFYRFPKSQWKCLRTTNPQEGLNSAFRRRTKTQGAFTHEDSALVLLWGLVAFKQIRMRKIDGYKDLQAITPSGLQQVA